MRIRCEEELESPSSDLTSMTDIVFLMLVFFLLATAFIDPERALDLELPRAEHARDPEIEPREIVIEVARDGALAIGGEPIAADDLEGELRRRAGSEKVPITIRGDRLAHHEAIVAVLDACGAAGLTDVSVGTIEGS